MSLTPCLCLADYCWSYSLHLRADTGTGRGGVVNIDVKNVLRADAEFLLTLDNVAFTTTAASVRVGGKKTGVVPVKFLPVDASTAAAAGAGTAHAGKLIVSCSGLDLPPWVFYLNGQV